MSNIQGAPGVQPIEIATVADTHRLEIAVPGLFEKPSRQRGKVPGASLSAEGEKVPGTKQQSHNGPCMAAAARSNRASQNSITVT